MINGYTTGQATARSFAADAEGASFAGPERSSKTIVILEDSDVVKDFLEKTLEAYGFSAAFAATPEEALERCRKGSPVRALIVDAMMTGMAGLKSLQKLLNVYPEMKIVYISGYPYEYLAQVGVLPSPLGKHRFLQKPFLPGEIVSILKSLR